MKKSKIIPIEFYRTCSKNANKSNSSEREVGWQGFGRINSSKPNTGTG
jgi:hypothetical protein